MHRTMHAPVAAACTAQEHEDNGRSADYTSNRSEYTSRSVLRTDSGMPLPGVGKERETWGDSVLFDSGAQKPGTEVSGASVKASRSGRILAREPSPRIAELFGAAEAEIQPAGLAQLHSSSGVGTLHATPAAPVCVALCTHSSLHSELPALVAMHTR